MTFHAFRFSCRYVEPKRYSSNGRDMTVVLRRASNSPTDEEYMEVSYYFHDGKSYVSRHVASRRKKKGGMRKKKKKRGRALSGEQTCRAGRAVARTRNKRSHAGNWIMTARCRRAINFACKRREIVQNLMRNRQLFRHGALSLTVRVCFSFLFFFFSFLFVHPELRAQSCFTRLREASSSFTPPKPRKIWKRSRDKIYPAQFEVSDSPNAASSSNSVRKLRAEDEIIVTCITRFNDILTIHDIMSNTAVRRLFLRKKKKKRKVCFRQTQNHDALIELFS